MNYAKRAIRRFSFWLMALTDSWEPVEPGWTSELEAELALHPGEWVAIAATHDHLVAAAATPGEVISACRAAGVEDAALYQVPQPGAVYILTATGA